MKLRRLAPIGAAALGAAGLVAGVAPAASASTSLTIWLMTGEITPNVYNAVDSAFEAQHPGVSVNVEIQQWSGITTKIDTALASSSPPDALEIGNTDVPEYAASGGLVNLTSFEKSINAKGQWLGGLQQPAEVKGQSYAVPLLAGDRVVLYNEQMFAHAGIKSAPTSVAQLLADGQKLKSLRRPVELLGALLPRPVLVHGAADALGPRRQPRDLQGREVGRRTDRPRRHRRARRSSRRSRTSSPRARRGP